MAGARCTRSLAHGDDLVIRYGIESLVVGFGFLLIVRTERIFTVLEPGTEA